VLCDAYCSLRECWNTQSEFSQGHPAARQGMKDLPTKIQGYPYELDASGIVFF
jgi:hypothetical protein